MRIRIVKCSRETYWYSGMVGQEFEAEDHDQFYRVLDDPPAHVCKGDCELVPKPWTSADRSRLEELRDAAESECGIIVEGDIPMLDDESTATDESLLEAWLAIKDMLDYGLAYAEEAIQILREHGTRELEGDALCGPSDSRVPSDPWPEE